MSHKDCTGKTLSEMTTFPQSMKLLDQKVDQKSKQAAEEPLSNLRIMSDFAYFTEDLVERLAKLRKERCEAAEKQESLLKRWSSQLSHEDNLLTQILDHVKQKIEIESGLRELQEEIPGLRKQIEDTENELVSLAHLRVKLTEDRLKNTYKSRCDVAERICEELTQSTVGLRQELEEVKVKHKRTEERLEEEKKQICRTCLKNNRNAVIMPCMHFLYCSDCLNTHQKKSKNCPNCSSLIAGVLHCKRNIE